MPSAKSLFTSVDGVSIDARCLDPLPDNVSTSRHGTPDVIALAMVLTVDDVRCVLRARREMQMYGRSADG